MCGEPALGVQRAVDRVDHDAHAAAAVVDLAALLADRGEAVPARVQRVELREDGVLGGGVDHQRAVAALAARRRSRPRARRVRRVRASTSRRPSAARRQAPSQSASERRARTASIGAHILWAVPAAARRPHPRAARGRHPPRRPAAVVGGAGTGKTRALVGALRVARRAGRRRPRRSSLLAAPSAAADALRRQVEDAIAAPLRGARRHDRRTASARACCATRRSRPGSTRSRSPVAPADRLAMLLERDRRADAAPHDFRGNPAALLAASSRASTA